MDWVSLLILSAIELLNLAIQYFFILPLVRALASAGATPALNKTNLIHPAQETEPPGPLLQDDRVVEESLHQRNLPTALATGRNRVSYSIKLHTI